MMILMGELKAKRPNGLAESEIKPKRACHSQQRKKLPMRSFNKKRRINNISSNPRLHRRDGMETRSSVEDGTFQFR